MCIVLQKKCQLITFNLFKNVLLLEQSISKNCGKGLVYIL